MRNRRSGARRVDPTQRLRRHSSGTIPPSRSGSNASSSSISSRPASNSMLGLKRAMVSPNAPARSAAQ
ncbi:MAG: hypothetical protein ACRDSJ_19615 [Rubrobacteraceae bacterium]